MRRPLSESADVPDPSARPTAGVAGGLGHLALIPFVVGAIVVWTSDADAHVLAVRALSVYAAVVVSFIGGIHWGLAFPAPGPRARLFVWGVMPSIVAWIAVLLRPGLGLVILAATLVACYLFDRSAYVATGIAAWLPLRLRLTIVAALCCVVGAVGS